MSAGIGQYIEALENPAGRFRTIEEIFPLRGRNGTLRLRAHRRYVDFDVSVRSRKAVLRVPLGASSSLAPLRTISSRLRRMHSGHFVPFEYLESEMTVFGRDAEPQTVDVCLQILPEHVGFEEFLHAYSAAGDREAIENMILRLVCLTDWAHRNSMGVAPSSLIVAQGAKGPVPMMVSVPRIDRSSQTIMAALLTAASPQLYRDYARRILLQPSLFGRIAGQLSQRLDGTEYDSLAALAEGCCTERFEAALSRIAAFSHQDFCNLKRLLAAPPRMLPAAQSDGEDNLLSHFYWTDDRRSDIICAMTDEGWKYVDKEGRQVIEATFRYAEPLREGRAEVETDQGKGLIDSSGRYIMPPQYEEVCWDDYYGVAVAMQYGRWTLHDRDGRLLTGQHFDYLGICSEGFITACRGGKWGYIDTAGRTAIPLRYDDASSFRGGTAQVTLSGDTFAIDITGRPVER